MERLLNKALTEPLFCSEEALSKIEGKLLYLLDVTRGKESLNALETRTIDMYREWCEQNGKDPSWPEKVLARKWKKKRIPRSKKRKKI